MDCFVGVDIGKRAHVAAFISPSLLEKHRAFEACPTIAFSQNLSGFEQLLCTMQRYAPLNECCVLMERTGHYHLALQEFLLEHGVVVYDIQVQRRPQRQKNDRRDAQGLANMLYAQIHLKAQPDESRQRVHRVIASSPGVVTLRRLVEHRGSLIGEVTQRKNRLTAITDQLFPEATGAIADYCCNSALAIREHFPTAHDVAIADPVALKDCCPGRRPSMADLQKLQELAAHSVGIHGERAEVLIFEQYQLVDELRMLRVHLEETERRIKRIIEGSREGKILTSIPCVGPVNAATIIAGIGNIANFSSTSKLKGYFGWSPKEAQSGDSLDRVSLGRGGNQTLKSMMYLIVWSMIRRDTEWRDLYQILVPQKCRWDAKAKTWKGRNKVLGHIAGRVIGVIYWLLRKDYDTLALLEPGETPPEPILYSKERHIAHARRNGYD